MTNLLTQDDVQALCVSIGFREAPARIASAIAMCEAPGPLRDDQPTADFDLIGDQALADEKWGYSYGGFQIRSLREQKGTDGFRDEDRLLRPRFNARAALAIKRESGWLPWSTFRHGMHLAYLQDEFPPPPGVYIVVSGDTLSGIAATVGTSWQELARLNNIHEPWRIFIGQHLTLP